MFVIPGLLGLIIETLAITLTVLLQVLPSAGDRAEDGTLDLASDELPSFQLPGFPATAAPVTRYSHIFPSVFNIGGVLSSDTNGLLMLEYIDEWNKPGPNGPKLPEGVRLNGTYIIMNGNPIRAAKSVCDHLIPQQLNIIIASRTQQHISDLSPMAVSFTCGFFKIPVIGVSARESSFSDKNVHSAFMRTVPPYSEQTEIWLEMLEYLSFKKIIFIHSSDQEGRAVLGRFQSQTETESNRIEKSLAYTTGQSSYLEELQQLTGLMSRVVLLYTTASDAEVIFRDAAILNMTGSGYAWIVTEQALNAPNSPIGVLGVRLVRGLDEAAHIEDSIALIAAAIKQLYSDGVNITATPSVCDDKSKWESGQKILKVLRNQEVRHGRTGWVRFNDAGDRMGSLYSIVNKQSPDVEKEVGSYLASSSAEKKDSKENQFNLNEKAIIWPGYEIQKPKGIKISTRLRVVTKCERPFIEAVPLGDTPNGQCDILMNRLPCPQYNKTTGETVEYCCHGYAMDLLVMLAQAVNFTFDLHLQEDDIYGELTRENGTAPRWTGMIGELVNDKADMIVAPLTINPERAEAIDFSKPYKYQGLTILVKKATKDSSLVSFLQPFQEQLWILVGLSVHVVALVLYLLDRFSPFGRFKLSKTDDTEEDALNLSSAMWFAWGVLLNSGIGEGTPRSFSARVLGMVWAGFAMIIVASYTANLAAFLVLDRPQASISGIDDARLRNPQESFKYATVKESAVSMYFKRQVELSTMYRTMEGRNFATPEEAIKQVKEGKNLQAFIWDSSRLEYEAANDCDLVTAGELFGRSGYGIGLQKNSPWTQDVSLAILSFHENGSMEHLDGKWNFVTDTQCQEKDKSPATLGLTNMAGVFMMVAGGIVAGVFIISIEIAYKRHRRLQEKELELAKTAADRWRGNIEKRRTLRRTLLQYQQDCQTLPGAAATGGLALRPNQSPVQPVRRDGTMSSQCAVESSSTSLTHVAGTSRERLSPSKYDSGSTKEALGSSAMMSATAIRSGGDDGRSLRGAGSSPRVSPTMTHSMRFNRGPQGSASSGYQPISTHKRSNEETV